MGVVILRRLLGDVIVAGLRPTLWLFQRWDQHQQRRED